MDQRARPLHQQYEYEVDGRGINVYIIDSGIRAAGIYCATSNGSTFANLQVWHASMSDPNGWNQAKYYRTIRLPDLNGDGRADLCGRGAAGVYCALSTGSSFGTLQLWMSSLRDSNGWGSPQYYETIRFGDVNGDGREDLCARGSAGMYCARSYGSFFSSLGLWQSAFSNSNGWSNARYYESLQLADVNADGRDDLCARGTAGLLCALSSGGSFGTANVWNSSFSDGAGWAIPGRPTFKTMRDGHGLSTIERST